jgi:hypothetical protein
VPKTIDYALTLRGFGRHAITEGICEFDNKDTYRVCTSVRGKGRPDNLSTAPGSGRSLWVFQRLKEGKQDKERPKETGKDRKGA